MTLQFHFFDDTHEDDTESATNLLEGFRYKPALIDKSEEAALLTRVRTLPFEEFDFHGYKGKRRVVSFGWQYEFAGAGRLRKANDIPEFLLPVRAIAASFAGLAPEAFQHVLVIEYGPGAGIGWHRDKPVFGQVVGVSLLAPCVLRFRRKIGASANLGPQTLNQSARPHATEKSGRPKLKTKWERVNVLAEPRAAYHLTGPARSEWEHSILRVDSLRYSITFRTMVEE